MTEGSASSVTAAYAICRRIRWKEWCKLSAFLTGGIATQETNMARRKFLAHLAGLPFLALGLKAEDSKKRLKIMMKSAWGSDDPTRAAFPFAHGLVLADAGHDVQI
ncbi:MAG: hypothetical protein WA823_06680, partial [Candidatus Acidiferrales bacterium]